MGRNDGCNNQFPKLDPFKIMGLLSLLSHWVPWVCKVSNPFGVGVGVGVGAGVGAGVGLGFDGAEPPPQANKLDASISDSIKYNFALLFIFLELIKYPFSPKL
jgi:hypothetical protein